jgi:uncharacterized protein
MLKEQVEPYQEFARPYYVNRDAAHNFRHIERLIGRLDLLSLEVSPPPNKALLYFLACFHGLGTRLHDDQQFCNLVSTFLHDLGWIQAEVEQAFQCLERHLKTPQTVEEEIVHDANYIELLGAFGIAKAFTTGGARGQSYEETVDIFENRYLDTVAFRTPMGKQIAEERRAYTKEFLRRLRSEW